MNYGNLNSKQIEAVQNTEGPLLILAGAGSGKTATMTHRMAYLIEKGVDPYNILAVTFTNKAAAEMRNRVELLADNTRGMWIMTFHAMCLRMLRKNCEALGYKPGFTVYDEADRKSAIRRIYKELDINEKDYPVSGTISIISKCKEAEQGPEEYFNENAGDFRSKRIYDIYSRYQEALVANNAMDFDDLLWNGLKLLNSDAEACEYYANRFKYIMVDEYQDTNYLQYKIVKKLASKHGNLCVVGDDDQCIYQWRGADIRNILDFESDFPNAKVIKLEQNYRSYGNILELAYSVIKNNRGRKSKKLWTEREAGEKIMYKRLGDEKQEAYYVATEVEKLRKEGYNYKDMAVLYRKNAQSRSFEERFSFRGVPFRVLSGKGFYERKEIKDVTSYLSLIENPDNDIAMLRVINEPKRGIGPKSLAGIQEYAKANQISIFKALCEDEVRAALSAKSGVQIIELLNMITDVRREEENLTLQDIYDNVLNRSGYLKALEDANTIEADGRIENIMEFKSVIGEFEKQRAGGELELEEDMENRTTLGSFLENITLMSDIDGKVDDEDSVTLMTLHSAKGLEFPVVFIPGMEEMMFPGPAAYDSESKMEEERRLCYVGITRAKEKLYLTGAQMRTMYGRTDYTSESTFIGEMDRSLMDGDSTMKERQSKGGGITGEGGLLGEYFFGGKTLGTADGYSGAPKAKPFDSLSYAKKQTKSAGTDEFEVGDTLKHPKFGEGMLIEQDDKTMTVVFDSVGRKKLGKGFVKMEKLN